MKVYVFIDNYLGAYVKFKRISIVISENQICILKSCILYFTEEIQKSCLVRRDENKS